MQTGDLLTENVTTLAFGGYGVMRHEGFVIFVPFAAPGDLLTVEITDLKRSHAYAKITQIHTPSPHRTLPSCSYFGTCGGCQLQHLSYNAQIEQKKQMVKDAFQRIGKLELPPTFSVVPAERTLAYRRHIRLSLKPSDNGFQAGYISHDNKTLITVSSCPIFCSNSDPILKRIQETISQMDSQPDNEGSLTVLREEASNGFILYFRWDNQLPSRALTLLESALQQWDDWKGVILESPQEKQILGNVAAQLSYEGMNFAYSAQAFVQNHPEQSSNIYRDVNALIEQSKAKTILDFYCGIGITSLLIAKQNKRVIGVEGNPEAIRLANENAERNGLLDKASFVQDDVQRVIIPLLKKWNPELAIVNPPRTGMSPKVLNALCEHSPKHLIYISCMPPTMARDVKRLIESGYVIKHSRSYDMFPQTTHVETVIHLQKD